jgi:hypothetical protein
MAEPKPVTKAEKPERSRDFTNCKYNYDCIMTATKAFCYNFNILPANEKVEFKSLNNYVKLLEKCIVAIKNIPIKVASRNVKKEVIPVDNETPAVAKSKTVTKPRARKSREPKGEPKEEPKEEQKPIVADIVAQIEAKEVPKEVPKELSKQVAKKGGKK